MKPILISSAFLISVIGIQHFLIEPCEERKIEEKYTRLSKVPAPSLLSSYLSSLFMGPLRALVINGLWMNAEKAREEMRFYLAKEMMDFITILQPRSEAAWEALARSMFLNVAPDELDPDKRYLTWERTAIEKLLEGIDHNAQSAVLTFELGYLLMIKAVPTDGAFNHPFITRFNNDTELQRKIQTDYRGNKTVFEISAQMFERSNEALNKLLDKRASTPFGFIIDRRGNDHDIRSLYYWHAAYSWLSNDNTRAKELFTRAAAKAREMEKIYGIPTDYGDFYEQFGKLIVLEEYELMRLGEKLLKKYPMLEDGYLSPTISAIKKDKSKDPSEFNDHVNYAYNFADLREFTGNIGPEEDDIDFFYVGSSREQYRLREIILEIENIGTVPLYVSSMTDKILSFKEISAANTATIEIKTNDFGDYFINMEGKTKGGVYKIRAIKYVQDLFNQKEVLATFKSDRKSIDYFYLGTSSIEKPLREFALDIHCHPHVTLKIDITNQDGKVLFTKEVSGTLHEPIIFKPAEAGSYFLRFDSNRDSTRFSIKLLTEK